MSADELRAMYEAMGTFELVREVLRLADMHSESARISRDGVTDRLGHSAGVALVVLTNRHPSVADELDARMQHAEATGKPSPFVDTFTAAVDASGVLAYDDGDDDAHCDDGRTCGCPNTKED